MSTIPLPQRGQPIDYNYLYTIINTINTITSNQNQQANTANVFTNGSFSTVSTSSLIVEAGYKEVIATPTNVSTTKSYQKTYNFKSNFKYAPVVTATPVVITDGTANHDALVVIDNVTSNAVTFTVKFPNTSTQKAAIAVNIIAIGI